MNSAQSSRWLLKVAVTVLFGLALAIQAAAQQRGPKTPLIPSQPVRPVELIREIARQAENIEDPPQRLRTLSSVLYNLEPFSAQQRKPVTDALQPAARDVDDQTVISTRASVVWLAPETGLRIARGVENQRFRETYLAELVGPLAKDNPHLARSLLDEISLPQARHKALLAYVEHAAVDFETAWELLAEVAPRGEWPAIFLGSWAIAYTRALSRFAAEHPEEVAEILQAHFKPDEALYACAWLAWELSHRLDAPQAAETLTDIAIELVPQTENPSQSAGRVIGNCRDQLEPAEAAELFDRFILPAIARREQRPESSLGQLASYDMDLLVSRAREVADLYERPLIEILPRAAAHASHGASADRVLAWLVAQPRSPLRDASIAPVASRLSRQPELAANARRKEWSMILSRLADEIDDPKVRWQAIEYVLRFSEQAELDTRDLLAKWRQLWRENGGDAGFSDLPLRYYWFGRLPVGEQRRRLALRFDPTMENTEYWKREQHPPWKTVRLIDYSSLPAAEKKSYYRAMAAEADSAMAKAAIASSLARWDYPAAVELMWQALPAIRDPRTPVECTIPPSEPPKNATTALRWLAGGNWTPAKPKPAPETVITTLWSHSASVPPTDRGAVLQNLAHALLDNHHPDQALGVARQINDTPVRLVLLSEIAEQAASAAAGSGEGRQ